MIYLEDTDNTSAGIFDFIDWEAIGREIKNTPELYQIWEDKQAIWSFGTGQMTKNWVFWDSEKC